MQSHYVQSLAALVDIDVMTGLIKDVLSVIRYRKKPATSFRKVKQYQYGFFVLAVAALAMKQRRRHSNTARAAEYCLSKYHATHCCRYVEAAGSGTVSRKARAFMLPGKGCRFIWQIVRH